MQPNRPEPPESQRLRDNEDWREVQMKPREKAPAIATCTDPLLFKGFSAFERLKIRSWRAMRRTAATPKSEKLLANAGKFEFDATRYPNMGLNIKIKRTSALTLDQNVLHPFVRFHIVDLDTFRPLEKQASRRAGSVANREYAGVTYTSDTRKIVRPINCDFLPPMATSFCDMRLSTDNWAEWNQEFVIHENLQWLFKPRTLILFELLDFNIISLAKSSKQDSALTKGTGTANRGWDNLSRIAWGYLRPVGVSGIHTGSARVQLYRFKHKGPRPGTLDERTPQVLLDFNWPSHKEYPGFLEVELLFKELPPDEHTLQEGAPVMHWSQTPYEHERGKIIYDLQPGGREGLLAATGEKEAQDALQDEMTKAERQRQIKLSKWRRGMDQNCLLPEKLLYRLATAELGCFRIKFSPNGLHLAAACSVSEKKTVIKIFDMEEGKQTFQLFGHQGVIHHLCWHQKNRYLLSTSSDCSVRLWLVPPRAEGKQMTEKGSYELLLSTIIHPSYVYAAQFQPLHCNKNRLLIATASFDSKVRIFLVTLDPNTGRAIEDQLMQQLDIRAPSEKSLSMLDSVHPNALVFNEEVMYVGDSRGSIHEWSVQIKNGPIITQKLRTIRHPDLEGDAINYLAIEPEEGKKLVVHSRDNCIRLLHHWGDRIKVAKRFFGSKCKDVMVRSVMSPDGQYLIAGSEDGTPHVWSVVTGTEEMEAARHFECALMDSVCDVDWNPKLNIIAMSGFGKEYPIMLYVYEKSREELALEQGVGFFDDYGEKDKLGETVRPGMGGGQFTPGTTMMGASFSQWRGTGF